MYVVIVGTSDNDSANILVGFTLLVSVHLLEMGEGLENGLPIIVVFGLLVRPLIFDQLGGFWLIACVSVHHLC